MSGSRATLSTMSKEELLVVIDNQAEQIKRFELRLRDTVSACKSLMKQKEALEASLQVLNQQKKVKEETPPSSREDASQPLSSDADVLSLPFSAAQPSPGDDALSALRHQMSTLTQSLATITAEKVRLEQLFIGEKKSLRAEYENKIEAILADKERQADEIRELRVRLSSPGLQGDSSDASPRRLQSVRDYSYGAESRLVERLKNQLRETEAQLFALQQTCVTKDAETISLEAERERADRAELLAGESEVRLRLLEQRIAELTGEIGRCDQSSLRDKQTVEKLEAKIRELQLANPGAKTQQSVIVAAVPPTRQTATFGTQTDSQPQPVHHQVHVLKPVETDHSLCLERISTLEGALACARKDFADAVARSWLVSASNPPPPQKVAEEIVEQQTPDLLLRPPPLLRPASVETKNVVEQEKQRQVRSSPDDNEKLGQRQISQVPLTNSDTSILLDYLPSCSDLELQQERQQQQQQSIQASGSAAPLLFYETEMSRLDSSLREARAANRKLERRFREIEQRLVADKLALQQSLDKLQHESEELRRATQTMPPDSAKLEFIRQILMRHLSTHDSKVRQQTALVLATALSFPADFSLSPSVSTSNAVAGGTSSSNLTRFFKS